MEDSEDLWAMESKMAEDTLKRSYEHKENSPSPKKKKAKTVDVHLENAPRDGKTIASFLTFQYIL